MARHPDVAFWLCVGDVADAAGATSRSTRRSTGSRATTRTSTRLRPAICRPASTTFATARLHDDRRAARRRPRRHVRADDVRDAGGESAASRKGHAARRPSWPISRRHFVREEVEACKALRGVDVLLTHEAPRPFRVSADGRRGAMTPARRRSTKCSRRCSPRLHLFGHHHRFAEADVQGVRSVCLDLVSQFVSARRRRRRCSNRCSLS